MIDRLLLGWVRFSRERSSLLVVVAVVGVASGVFAATVPLDLSFAGVMNRAHPEVERYFSASETYGLGGLLLVLLEGPEERLEVAASRVRDALGELPEVRAVEDGAAFTGRSAPQPQGARLVRLRLARDTFELALDADDFPNVRRRVREVVAVEGVAAHFAGMPAIITQEQEATLERMRWLGPLSFLLVLVILCLVERRPMILVSIALPMLLSIACTLALVGGIAGELTIMESIFGVLVFGLGIDFALHLLFRLREERSRGRDFEESLRLAFTGTGRAVLEGGWTTAGAFLILSLSPDPVFYRLGLSGGIGLTLCLVFLLTFLPAEWAWLERRSSRPTPPLSPPSSSALGRIAAGAARRPALVLAGTVVALAAAGAALPRLAYETDLTRVFSRDIEAVKTADRIQALFGVHPGVWLATASDLAEARRITAAFEADPLFERAESLARYLPQSVEAAVMERMPDSVRDRFVGPDGELLVWAYTREARLDSALAARERRSAQAIAPEATSMNAIYEALIGTDRPWLPPIMAAVAVFVAVLLRLDLGTKRHAFLALTPAIVSLVLTLGVLAMLGLAPNTVTLVAFPLLLGLGVDDGIHVVHRMIEQPDAETGDVVGAVARSIALTTATTCGSVSLLLLSRHPGIESVATVLLLGLPLALLATVTVVPALAVTFGVRRRG